MTWIWIKIWGLGIGDWGLGNINNISIDEYEETQKINLTKIICDNCKKINKANSYQNLFYRCNIWQHNLCVLWKDKHDINHSLINLDDINYICKIHNEPFTFYCKSCKKIFAFLTKLNIVNMK